MIIDMIRLPVRYPRGEVGSVLNTTTRGIFKSEEWFGGQTRVPPDYCRFKTIERWPNYYVERGFAGNGKLPEGRWFWTSAFANMELFPSFTRILPYDGRQSRVIRHPLSVAMWRSQYEPTPRRIIGWKTQLRKLLNMQTFARGIAQLPPEVYVDYLPVENLTSDWFLLDEFIRYREHASIVTKYANGMLPPVDDALTLKLASCASIKGAELIGLVDPVSCANHSWTQNYQQDQNWLDELNVDWMGGNLTDWSVLEMVSAVSTINGGIEVETTGPFIRTTVAEPSEAAQCCATTSAEKAVEAAIGTIKGWLCRLPVVHTERRRTSVTKTEWEDLIIRQDEWNADRIVYIDLILFGMCCPCIQLLA